MAAVIYGYVRISTPKQNIERQIRNIKSKFPDAVIIEEIYTGTKINRKGFEKLVSTVKSGDSIVFDSVSRMSRNSTEGILIYKALYKQGVELIFLKEPHIDTAVYKRTLQNRIAKTGEKVDVILEAINEYLMLLAEEQIQIAFNQAEKEVQDLHQRTREGIHTARINGKQIGRKAGVKYITKKEVTAKEIILAKNKSFGGYMNDEETMKICGISHNTLYRYKKELKSNLSE